MTRGPALDAEALLDLPLFSGLTAAELAGLEAHLATEQHPRGTNLFRRGDFGDALYVVISGQVALELRSGPNAEVLALCAPGDWFGELALLTSGPRTADARVTVDATLLRVSRAGWTELSLRAPNLFARLCERLSRQLRAASEPPRPVRRAVIHLGNGACGDASWVGGLARSLSRQFPTREVHLLGSEGQSADMLSLESALARLPSPEAVILLAGAEAERLADRRLQRRGPCEWTLEPGRGKRPREIIRGRSPEETLDRVARHLAGGTIGVALGAGGAYGFAHLGVLRVLERAGVPIDYVGGASMGAIVGSALAAGVPVERLIAFAGSVGARFRGLVIRDLALRGPALLRGTAVMRMLAELEEVRDATFESLMLPFVAIAMDVRSGEEVLLDTGPVLEGIRPSFAIPGIFPSCTLGKHEMVDGAMVNPVPVDRVRDLGADFVIAAQPIPSLHPVAVDPVGSLLGRARWIADFLPLRPLRRGIETLDVSIRSYQALWHRLATVTALGADAVVDPDLHEYWFLQFGDATPIIAAGERAAEAALRQIRTALAERLGLDTANAAIAPR